MIRWSLVCAAAVLVAGCGVTACDTDNMREDVLLCEEAVAHLQKCCGTGVGIPFYACDYASTFCLSRDCSLQDSSPALSAQASRDIMAKDCARVVHDGECSSR
jgi:hypothetical protein